MEAQLIQTTNQLQINSFVKAEQNNTINLNPYQNLLVSTISDFSNQFLSYAAMLEIGQQEIELLLIAKAKNPGKINIERLIPRNVRLAILNKLNNLLA